MKKILLSFFVAVITMPCGKAQSVSRDSATRAAQADVKNFRLNDADLDHFRKSGRNPNSDYFKPAIAGVSNSTFLKDSTYVKTYREMAFKKTKKRRTAGHYILFGGIALVVVFAVLTASAYNSVVTGYN